MTGLDSGERICTTCGAPADRAGRFCAMCGSALATNRDTEGVRRTVVILFADLVGFTSISEGLDPEVLRTIMDRYFRMASGVIWNYGGTTEKFIGDAVMAVFGMPVVREDDAYRAVNAAWDLVQELDALNEGLDRDYGIRMRVRVGVHSGPVSASYDTFGNFRVVGDAVNTASRLQSAAGAQQVIVGPSVAQVVRNRVDLAELPPLTLKGKELPVAAWRVVGMSVNADAVVRRVPFIGRDLELLQLRTIVGNAFDGRRGGVAALLGPPGIGKTRLVEEACAAFADRSPTVLTGRAHSYGRGVTYRPIVEMLASAPAAWSSFERLAETDPLAARARDCLAGLSRAAASGSGGAEVEEIAWALRTFVAATVEHTPLVLVWEDLHWAEPTLLDVIDFLGDELPGLGAAQICVARPELLDGRPSFTSGGSGALTLELQPLTVADTRVLVETLARSVEVMAHGMDDTCARVAGACEGNPLYAELMMDMVSDDTITLPHSVQAVLAARLDRLDAADRRVLEMAAVAGRDFVGHDVEHLNAADGRPGDDVPPALDRLRRARLLAGSRLSARYTFAQAFSRDTTYELTAKRDRLRWHLALSRRPYAVTDMPVYHLESALLLMRELHPNSPDLHDLATRAGAELTEQARDAMNRKDLRAAVGLFERARTALPADAAGQLAVTVALSDTWLRLDDRDRAQAVLAGHPGLDRRPVAAIAVQAELIDCRAGRRTAEEILDAERRLEALLDRDDALGWCLFHQLRAHRHLTGERVGAAEASLAEALARSGDDTYQRDRIRRAAGELTLWGPTPVADGLSRCDELTGQFADSRVSLIPVLATKAGLLALDGRFDAARDILGTAKVHAEELRMQRTEVGFLNLAALIESLAGAPDAAARLYDRARAVLATAGHTSGAALLAAYAARELIAAGRRVPASGVPDDELRDPRLGAMTAVLSALSAAERGDGDAVAACAARAATHVDGMDDVFFRGCVHRDLAGALARSGRADAARAEAAAARSLFAAKGARAAIPGVDALIARLTDDGEGENG
jgi:class 3 adenylate cyclase